MCSNVHVHICACVCMNTYVHVYAHVYVHVCTDLVLKLCDDIARLDFALMRLAELFILPCEGARVSAKRMFLRLFYTCWFVSAFVRARSYMRVHAKYYMYTRIDKLCTCVCVRISVYPACLSLNGGLQLFDSGHSSHQLILQPRNLLGINCSKSLRLRVHLSGRANGHRYIYFAPKQRIHTPYIHIPYTHTPNNPAQQSIRTPAQGTYPFLLAGTDTFFANKAIFSCSLVMVIVLVIMVVLVGVVQVSAKICDGDGDDGSGGASEYY